jgi:hypothetical protein
MSGSGKNSRLSRFFLLWGCNSPTKSLPRCWITPEVVIDLISAHLANKAQAEQK